MAFVKALPAVVLVLIVLGTLLWGLLGDKAKDPITKKRTGPGFYGLRGADGRYSTSKLAAFAWLVAVVGAAAYLLTKVALTSATLDDVGLKVLDEQYLVLMGTPVATLIASKGVVESKVNAGRLQKPQPDKAAVSNSGGFTVDDTGKADVLDVQYLLFNIVLLLYFATSVLAKTKIPTLPPTLVALTGVAAAAYVAGKVVAANPPVITAITAEPTTAGTTKLDIRGQNLIKPTGDDAALKEKVAVNGFTVNAVSWSEDGTRVQPVVNGTPPKGTKVVVTTAANVTASAELS